MGLLLKDGVNVAVSRNFGPNIKRIQKKFVCVRIVGLDIAEGIKVIQKNIDSVRKEWERGEERKHLTLSCA